MKLIPKLKTGIVVLDQITGGGFPKSSCIALIGRLNSDKDVLLGKVIWSLLCNDVKILYYSINQSSQEFYDNMADEGWDLRSFHNEERIHVVDIFSNLVMKAYTEVAISNDNNLTSYYNSMYDIDLMYNTGKKFLSEDPGDKVCILNSISPILSTNSKKAMQILIAIKKIVKSTNSIGISVMHTDMHDKIVEQKHHSLVDGIIEIKKMENSTTNFITIQKYLGVARRGPFPLERTTQGVNIIPIEMPELAKVLHHA